MELQNQLNDKIQGMVHENLANNVIDFLELIGQELQPVAFDI